MYFSYLNKNDKIEELYYVYLSHIKTEHVLLCLFNKTNYFFEKDFVFNSFFNNLNMKIFFSKHQAKLVL
jgi:hypothetical protein